MAKEDDVKSAANAVNDRTAGLDFEVSVVPEDELEDGMISPRDKDTLIGSKSKSPFDDDSPNASRMAAFCGCFSLSFYKPFFDVDTSDVQQRLLRAFFPFKKNPPFYEVAQVSPDAYGPVWIATTLIFALASGSNAASYLDFDGDHNKWAYDFSRLASAYTLVQVFLIGLPVVLWLGSKYVNAPVPLSFLMCLYGYSSVIFIPATLACIAPMDAVDWIVLLVCMAWSLYFLLTNLWGVVSQHLTKEKTIPMLAFISVTQLIWVVLVKLLFY